jgi:hypothetical protein
MKSLVLLTAILLLNSFSTFAQEQEQASSAELQKWIALEKEETRANYSDLVLVVIVKVKDESKKDFETWVDEVLYNALNNSESEMKKAQLKATRWLEPTKQNGDGSWTYSWIMDPVIPKTNYDIQPFLINEYGEKAGKDHWQKYLTFMAGPPQSYMFTQTDY